jgi:hypothetical protein
MLEAMSPRSQREICPVCRETVQPERGVRARHRAADDSPEASPMGDVVFYHPDCYPGDGQDVARV